MVVHTLNLKFMGPKLLANSSFKGFTYPHSQVLKVLLSENKARSDMMELIDKHRRRGQDLERRPPNAQID